MAPTTKSHDLACPPPPYAHPPILRPSSVFVHANGDYSERLRAALAMVGTGDSIIAIVETWPRKLPDESALLWWSDELPLWARTLEEALKLSETRWVVVTLGVFAKWLQLESQLQWVRTQKRPPGARMTTGCFLTNGVALLDVIEWFTREKSDTFVQRRIKSNRALTNLLGHHHFETVFTSSPEAEKETRHPVCLFHGGERGGLFVADPGPMLESVVESGMPTPAALILVQLLGIEPTQLGQFAALPQNDAEFCSTLGELVDRYPMLDAVPRAGWSPPPPEAIIHVGSREIGFRSAVDDRPLIVIRSGFSSTEYETVYGVLCWIKQLLRHEPYTCPYRDLLLNRFRICWVPRKVEMKGWDDQEPRGIDGNTVIQQLSDGRIDFWLDIMGNATSDIQVSQEANDTSGSRLTSWLPRLVRSMNPRAREGRLTTVVDPDLRQLLPSPLASLPRRVLRLAVPIPPCPLDRRSILQSDLVSQLVEWIIGLHIGVIAVNRRSAPVQIETPPGYENQKDGVQLMNPSKDVESPIPSSPGALQLPPASFYLDAGQRID